jgi:hypothetical protein
MRLQESIRLPDGSFSVVAGDYDVTKPIRYEFQAGKASRVAVQIPTKTSIGDSYTVIDFNPHSGAIIGVSHLSIYP